MTETETLAPAESFVRNARAALSPLTLRLTTTLREEVLVRLLPVVETEVDLAHARGYDAGVASVPSLSPEDVTPWQTRSEVDAVLRSLVYDTAGFTPSGDNPRVTTALAAVEEIVNRVAEVAHRTGQETVTLDTTGTDEPVNTSNDPSAEPLYRAGLIEGFNTIELELAATFDDLPTHGSIPIRLVRAGLDAPMKAAARRHGLSSDDPVTPDPVG